MSYILDALRRADSERARGTVPGIHTQPYRPDAADAPRPARGKPWMWTLAGFVAALLLGIAAWRMFGPEAPREVAAAAPAAPPPPIAGPAPAPTVVAPPVALAPAAPRVASAPLVAAAATETTPKARRPVAKAASAAASGAAAAAAKSPAKPDKAASASAAESRTYAQSELPDDIRRQLPTLTIGGSMYSNDPANRILIINGQVFHEGDKLGPELLLEQIKLKAAVLVFKGYRYGITY